MKKIYIKPENVVVAVNVKEHLMEPSSITKVSGVDDLNVSEDGTGSGGINSGDAREVIRSRGAWDEW